MSDRAGLVTGGRRGGRNAAMVRAAIEHRNAGDRVLIIASSEIQKEAIKNLLNGVEIDVMTPQDIESNRPLPTIIQDDPLLRDRNRLSIWSQTW